MQKYVNWVLAGIVGSILGSQPAESAEFCAGTDYEVYFSLAQASGNGEDDIVRVVQGNYTDHMYGASEEAYSLIIEGGYTDGCTSRVVNPNNTVFDGNQQSHPLYIITLMTADITVDGITFQHGINLDKSYQSGGGLSILTRGGHIRVTNSRFIGNAADFGGGGLLITPSDCQVMFDTVELVNNTFGQNTAYMYGGALFLTDARELILTNNTIVNNTGYYGGGGIFLGSVGSLATPSKLYNNIFWNNEGSDVNDNTGMEIFHNLFQSMEPTDTPIDASNLKNIDPLFHNMTGGDYHLSSNSPCIDAGENNAPGILVADQEGQPRIVNSIVDMGVYEYSASTTCDAGDLNCDGSFNIFDLQLLVNCIFGSGSCDNGDLNGDGNHNIFDLQQLINKIFNP